MTGGGPPRGSIAETVQTTDGFLRHAGREFLVVLYTAVRSLKLYPLENAQVQKALDDLTATTTRRFPTSSACCGKAVSARCASTRAWSASSCRSSSPCCSRTRPKR